VERNLKQANYFLITVTANMDMETKQWIKCKCGEEFESSKLLLDHKKKEKE